MIKPMPSGTQGPSGDFAKAIAAQVREAMARHRISGSKLAARIGVSQSYLSKRLRDEAPLSLNDVEDICAALGEDAKALIARSGDRPSGSAQ